MTRGMIARVCGRYTLKQLGEDFVEELGVEPAAVPDDIQARFNIAPTEQVLVVPNRPHRSIQRFRWGLVPYWAKDVKIGVKHLNARAESLASRHPFEGPLRRRRCAILADGFYEWAKTPTGKAPYFVQLRGGKPFTFAGLWDRWKSPDGESLFSCTIITVPPNELLRSIHDRMPALLSHEAREAWLSPDERTPEELTPLLRPYPAEEMELWAVSRRVNTVANDDPSLVERV
jgi:putative SOS response-associated peptidase YedK